MKQIQCAVCGSSEMAKSGRIFVCRNCGSKFLPDSYYEEKFLEDEDIPTIDEILAHDGINPVRVERGYRGITIIDEYTGKIFTVDEYKKYIYELTHPLTKFQKLKMRIGPFFEGFFDILSDTGDGKILRIIYALMTLAFVIIGILSIRGREPFWTIVYRFYIAACGLFGCVFASAEKTHWIWKIVIIAIQILIGYWLFFGTFLYLEWIWRLLISIVLSLANFFLAEAVSDEFFKLYPVNRTVGVLKNPTDRQAITLKFGQRIQTGIH